MTELEAGTEAKVAVIVPNWNGARVLLACLDSLADQSLRGFTTLVVDNGSRDESLALLRRHHPWARVIALPRNTGFTGAVNTGLAESRSEFVALVNNDVVLAADWLQRMLDAAGHHPQAGLFAARIVYADDPKRIYAAGDELTRSGRARGIGRGEADGAAYDREREVFAACGGAAFYRRALLAATGGLDPDFFAYVEDTDLAFRAHALGWHGRYVPEARAYHVGGASLKGRGEVRSLYCLRNHLYFVIKNYPARLALRNRREVLGGVAREIRFTFAAVRGRHGGLAALAAVAGTLTEVVVKLPKMLWRRWRTARTRRVPVSTLEALFP